MLSTDNTRSLVYRHEAVRTNCDWLVRPIEFSRDPKDLGGGVSSVLYGPGWLWRCYPMLEVVPDGSPEGIAGTTRTAPQERSLLRLS